jgi:sulfide:quinone oxidoreductase
MTEHTVVVLGGGTGGIVAARRLRRLLDPADRVVLIDRAGTFHFAPSFLWVMTHARRPEQVSRPLGRLRRSGIEVLHTEAHEIDTAHRLVRTSEAEVGFDRLVIALGAELAPDTVPGFAAGAHNIYALDGASAAGQALRHFDGGRIAIMVSSLPYKCPAAPYEAAFLTEALLRRRIPGRARIDIYTPEPFPMPTAGPDVGQALTDMLTERGIGFHPDQTVDHIDPEARAIVLAGGRREEYDLLLGIPPHQAPAVARTSGLTAETGFLPTDPATLATSTDGVFAIGDVTTIPLSGGRFLPKAGVFAEAQAMVAARTIAAGLAGRTSRAAFDGKGACFVELGDGRAAFATGDFYAPDGPQVRMRSPGRHWHWAKVALEQYWMRRWT